MKRKRLLFAVIALIAGALGFNAYAQVDVTSTYLVNADLSTENSGWTYYSDAYKYQQWRTGSDNLSAAVEFYAGWGSLEHTNFKFSQTPKLPAGDYRIAVNAFFREGNDGDGTNAGKAWIFAGEKKQNVYGLQSGGLNAWSNGDDMEKAMAAFHDGQFSNAFDFSLSEESTIEIGFEGKFDAIRQWCILGPVKLYKYSLNDYLADYRAKVADAEALYNSPMNAGVLSALQSAVVDESTFSLSSQVTDAIQALTTAINNANTSIAKYVTAKGYLDKASTLDAAGQSVYASNEAVTALQSAYDDRSLVEVTADQASALDAAIILAVKSQTTANTDMTLAIVNPSFESDFSGWTNQGMGIQNNDAFEKDGNKYAEVWQPNGTFSVKQSLTLLSAGVYQISAKTKARGVTSAKLFANGVESNIPVGDATNITKVEFACDANSSIEFGFEGVGTGAGTSWLCVDDFHLTYLGSLPDVTPVVGKMNADIETAQTTAISTYNSNKTIDNYNAAVAAINAAQASVEAYEKLGTAIAKIDVALADATSATASDDDYQAIKTAYNNGTIADADIQANVKAAYDAIIPVIKSQTAVPADFTFAIQNQSFEYGDMTGWTTVGSYDTGVRETSNATYAAEGSNGNYLFNTWSKGVPVTQTVAGLPNGEYKLTVSVASDGATIYLLGNGGHNEGIETGGTYPGKDYMQETTFTFLVMDGTATIGVVGGAAGTAGEHKDYVEEGDWWYKADNFRLVKIGDIPPVSVTIASSGKSSYCNAAALDFSNVEGLKAYTVLSVSPAGAVLSEVSGAVAGGTGLVLMGTGGQAYEIPVVASGETPSTNMLIGTTKATEVTADDGEILLALSGGEFRKMANGTVPANKAYLCIESSIFPSSVKSLGLIFDGADAINSVEAENVKGGIYNLAGQRMSSLQKGINIVNGVKVIVK